MAAPSLSTEAGLAGSYPAIRFNQRERKLLSSVKTYVDSLSPDTIITTQGDIIIGDASGLGARLAKGAADTVLVAGASTVSYATLVNANISASAAIAYSKLASLTSGNILVGSAGNVPTAVAMSGDATIIASGALTIANDAITTAKILNSNVTLAKLASGITPSHVIKYAAAAVASTGGSATMAKTVSGVLSTDVVHVTLRAVGGTPRTIITAIPSTDTITIVWSGDPSTDHTYDYSVMRAAS